MARTSMPDYTSYLLRADSKDTQRSIRFGLPTVISVTETVKADLTTFPTIMFGSSNNYAIDLGNTKTIQASFVRVNPASIDDT